MEAATKSKIALNITKKSGTIQGTHFRLKFKYVKDEQGFKISLLNVSTEVYEMSEEAKKRKKENLFENIQLVNQENDMA